MEKASSHRVRPQSALWPQTLSYCTFLPFLYHNVWVLSYPREQLVASPHHPAAGSLSLVWNQWLLWAVSGQFVVSWKLAARLHRIINVWACCATASILLLRMMYLRPFERANGLRLKFMLMDCSELIYGCFPIIYLSKSICHLPEWRKHSSGRILLDQINYDSVTSPICDQVSRHVFTPRFHALFSESSHNISWSYWRKSHKSS